MGRKYCIPFILLLVATLKLTAQSGFNNLEFIENKGQWDNRVRFMGDLKSGAFYLEKNGFTVVLHKPEDVKKLVERNHAGLTPVKGQGTQRSPGNPESPEGVLTSRDLIVHSHAFNMRFEGGAAQPDIVPEKKMPGYNNYILGNDPSKWATECQVYQAVVYRNVYPNIDVRYYTESGQLKYDLIVRPGGDVEKIALKYDGVDKLSVKNGELLIKTSVGEVKELYPYSYQFNGKSRNPVECNYQLTGNTVKFKLKGYDKSAVLVIDPTLIFSSFTGSTQNQFGFTATPGPDGSLFSGGIVFGQGFPVSPGAYQTNYTPGGSARVDMGIFKFNSTGTNRVYATYLGGNNDDFPHSLIADPQGNLIILGRSYSEGSFPGTLVGAGGGGDIVVTKLNAAGTGLIGSLRIGGSALDGVNMEDQQRGTLKAISILRNYGDDSRSEVVTDNNGFIYVAAQTQSAGTFPILPSPGAVFQQTFGGGTQDAVVIKIDPNVSSVLFSSYLGGNGNDGAFGIKVHPQNGNIYVVGATSSNNLPDVAGTIGTSFSGGDCDGFVSIISNDGSTRLKSTYLGTAAVDVVYAVQFDNFGFPYVMGITRGTWPVVNATYSNPNSKQFISKLQPDLSAYAYSTVFGSGSARPNISPVAFLVDRCENVYASGWGGWIDDESNDPYGLDGTSGMPVTSDAIKPSTDNRDFYFIVIERNATSLLYGSFFGQNGGEGEHVDGGTSRFDRQGAIYQAICANCFPQSKAPTTPYPTTPGVWAPTNLSGDRCDLAALKISFNFSGVEAAPKASINGVGDTSGCVPMTVDFSDTLQLGKTYEWDFNGDGVTDQITTTPGASFTFNTVGSYRVRLITVDSTTCNIRDTAFVTVRARNDEALLDFLAQKQGACESLEYQFSNLSVPPAGKPFGNRSFIWDFGDNTPKVTTGPLPVNHTYANPGTYVVRLILVDTNYCNAPDTVEKELRIAPLVDARILTPANGCVPYAAEFRNVSLAGQQFFWDFGDGNTSTAVSPTHLYTVTGTYTVKLVAIDSATCNIIDSTETTVTVNPVPTAAFTSAPVPAQENTPTTFFNNSIGGSRYKWLFGDGDSAIRTTMDTVMHQYIATGTYNACLITINQFGCPDTVCNPVEAVIKPLLDVPNAFTPGRPGSRGKNHTIRPEGFGMSKVMFRIYNRWGQKVFETTDARRGWDGTFKGVLQPMDVYVYTLEVEFSDGTRTSRKGDITLIR
ncbi:MAG TPA: PKD domain-containing protein [Chitinophagaceae bacterium]